MRSRLTYSNVIATLALFLALGGGAVAALKLRKNSVGSKQIKPDAVKGIDADEASFAKVPNADALDGRDGNEIDRRLRFSVVADDPNPDFSNLFTLGAFRFSAKCIDESGDPHLVLQVEDVAGGATKTGSISTVLRTDHGSGAAVATEGFLSLQPDATLLDLDSNDHVGTATIALSGPDQAVTGILSFDVFPDPDEGAHDCKLNGTLTLGR